VNLAPFSSFAWVSQYPAMLGITVVQRPTGIKDTARNIAEVGDYVVNIATDSMLEPLHLSSEGHGADISEASLLGLETAPSVKIRTPRLATAPISMECVLRHTVSFGAGGDQFIIGEVVAWHIDDAVMVDGRIDTELLRPLGRLAGPRYTNLGDVTTMSPVPGG
jgi:flavin reductase (DIM6/NTAB) family NADH-FMN oxidoreductase RutF